MDPLVFEEHRPRLFRIAYRMVGTIAEAEDVVQEAFLRWRAAPEAERPGAYLATIVTRLCLDVLKSARVKRQEYAGQWLPDVCATEATPESVQLLADELSYGFVAMLERLTPRQRAVFVLRVAFDLDYDAIAGALDTSAASCRQLMKKARARMAGPARFSTDHAQSQAVARRFADACNAADRDQLMALLAEPCRFLSDGGGVVNAAQRPVLGADRVARMLVGLRRKHRITLTPLERRSGSSPLLRVTVRPDLEGVLALDVDDDGRVTGVFVQYNRDKLRHVPL